MESEFKSINLKCPGCGAPLMIDNNMERFSCGYCGSEQIVLRRGGTVALSLIGDAITKVQVGTDKTAAELAIKRLRDDHKAAEERYKASLAAIQLHESSSQGLVKPAVFSLAVGMTFVFLGLSGGKFIAGGIGALLAIFGAFLFYLHSEAKSEFKESIVDLTRNYSDQSAVISKQITEKLKEVS